MKFHLPYSLYKAILAVVCAPGITLAGNVYAQSAHYAVYAAAEAPATLQWDCTGTEPAVWDREQPDVWTDETGNETIYRDGANVFFGESADINKNILITPEEVTAESVEIVGTGYSFEGGNMVVTEQIRTAATVTLENTLIMGSTSSPLTIDVADDTTLTTAYLGTTYSESNGTHIHEHGSFTKVGEGTLSVTQDIHGFITNATILGGTMELGKGVTMDVGSNEILGGTLENVQIFTTGDITRTLTHETVTAHNVIKSANNTHAALLTNVSLHAGTETAYATLQNVVFAGDSSLTGFITFESTHAQREMGVATGSTLNVSNATFELRGIASGSKVLIVNGAVSDAANGLLSGITLPDNISGLGGSITGWDTVKFVYSGVAINQAAVNSSVAGTVTLQDKHDGNLYWDGSENGTWDAVTGNWSLVDGKNGDEVFTALSNVYFGSGDISHKDISVLQDSVIMNLNITDGGYTFTGARIAILNDAYLHPGAGSVTFNDQLVVQGNLVASGGGSLELLGAATVGKNAQISTLNTNLSGDLTVGGSLTINAGNETVAGSLSIAGNVTAKEMNIAVSAGVHGNNAYDNALVNVTGNLSVGESGKITIGGTAEQHYLGVVQAGDLTVNTQEHEVYFDYLHVGSLTVDKGAHVHVQAASAAVSLSSSEFPVINLSGTLSLDAHDVTYDRGYDVYVQDDAASLSFGTGCTIANMKIYGKADESGYTNLSITARSRSATVEHMEKLGNLSVRIGSVTVKDSSGAIHGTLSLDNGKLNLAEGSDDLMATNSGNIKLTNGSRLNIGSTAQHMSASNTISLSSASSITGAAEGPGLVFADGSAISYAKGDNSITANMVVNHTLNIRSEQSGSSLDISGELYGNGIVQLSEAGTVALSGANTFSGTVTVGQYATLSLQNEAALIYAGVTINNGGTLALDTDTAVYLNAFTFNNGATLSFSTISDTDEFSADHAALHVTNGAADGFGTLNISFAKELDTLRTYNLLTGLSSLNGITLNVMHNGVALNDSQYKVGFNTESGLLYIQTLMGNVWEGKSDYATKYQYGIWSTSDKNGNWSGGSDYQENVNHKAAIFGDLDAGAVSKVSINGTVAPGDIYFVADETSYEISAMEDYNGKAGYLAYGTNIHKEGLADVTLQLFGNMNAATALGSVDIQAGSLILEEALAVSGTVTIEKNAKLEVNGGSNLVGIPIELKMGPKTDGSFSYTVSSIVSDAAATLCGVTMDAAGIRGLAKAYGKADKLLVMGNADLSYLTLTDFEAKGNVTLSNVTLSSSAGASSHYLENVTIGEGVVVEASGRYTLSGNITFEDTLTNNGRVTMTDTTQVEIGKIKYAPIVDTSGKFQYVYQLISSVGNGVLNADEFTSERVSINGVNLANGLATGIKAAFKDNRDGSFTVSIDNGTVGMPQWDDDWGKTENAPGISRLYVGTNAANIELAADYYKYSSIVNVDNAAKVNNGKAIAVTLSSVATGTLAAGNRTDDGNNVIAADHEVWIEDRSELENVIAGSANLTDKWTDTFQTAATHILVNSDFKKDPDSAALANPNNPDVIKDRSNWAKKFIIGGSRWTAQGMWGTAANNWQNLVAESFVTVLNGEIYTIFGGSCRGYYETENWSANWNVTADQLGTAHVFIEGGRIGEIFAAGMHSTLTGTQMVNGRNRAVELVLTGGKLGGRNLRVFGGGERGTVYGDIYIRMEGNAEIISRLLGGSNAGYVKGNIEMDLISGKAFRVDAAGLGWKEVYEDGSVWEDRAKIEGNVLVNLYSAFELGHGEDSNLKAGIYGGMENTNYVDLIGDCTSTLHFAESATYNLGRLSDDGYTASENSIIVTGFDRFKLKENAHAVLALGYFDIDMDTSKTLIIEGNGVVEVIGHGENFGRNIKLTDGATLKVSTSVIGLPDDDSDDRTITVTSGTTLDITGYPVESEYTASSPYAGLSFKTEICGDGVDGKGAIFKGTTHETETEKALSLNKVSLPFVKLTGNASVGVMNHEVLHMSGYNLGETTLELNGYTFTKQGLGAFVARNVQMSEGTVLVHQGDFYIDKVSHSEKTDIVMAAGTSLHLNSTNTEEKEHALTIRALSGAGHVTLNDAELTLNTASQSSYQPPYMDESQTYDQFMSTTGFGYAVFSGTISEGSGVGAISKTGDGVHYISGSANTYSGGTSVYDGRLYLLGTSEQSQFIEGASTVAFGVAGTGTIFWAGADAELYLGHDVRIYNEGTTNVAGGIMTIGVEGALNGVLADFIGIHSKGTTPVVRDGVEYVEIETHNLKSIAVDAMYADGTKYVANTDIDHNKMLLVKMSDWESAKDTKVTGFSDIGYNEAVYSGVLYDSDNIAAKLHKVGVGTLVLDQSNSYTGGTLIEAGTLRVRGWGKLGNNAKENTVNVQDGATLMFTHNGGYGNEPTSAANDITISGSGDTRWQDHAATDGGTAALISAVGPSVTFTLSGDINGNGNIRHSGEGVLVLNGDSSYTGGTYASRGTIEVQSATGLGATADGSGSVTIESDADMKVTVEDGYTKDRMVTTLAADVNDIQGDVLIAGTAETERILHMEGNGYHAASTTLNEGGTLLLNGDTIKGAPVSAHSGVLTGSGTVVVSDAAATGATATFDSMINYTGDLRVEGDKASIQAQNGSFYGGSIHVAGQQASVSIGGNVSIVDGESLHLSSTGSAHAQVNEGNNTAAGIYTAGTVSVAPGAELSVSYQETEYLYNLKDLQKAISIHVNEKDIPTGAEPVFHAIGDNTIVYDLTYDSNIALNRQASGAIQASGGLILDGGSTYTTVEAHISLMGGRLTLDAMENNLLILNTTPDSDIDRITLDTQLVLFSDVGSVSFAIDNVLAEADTGVYFTRADRYFTGCDYIDEHTLLVYDADARVVYLHHAVPEPTTATLSLLALAALAARRRRR